MRPPLVLTSPDNPRIKQILHLRKHRHRRESGLFVVEGLRELSRAGEAKLEIRDIFLCPSVAKFNWDQLLNAVSPSSHPSLFEITPLLLSKISYLENPEGVLAIVHQPDFDFSSLPAAASSDLFLVAAGLNKPGNLGAMARTALAAGVTVLLSDSEIDEFNPNAIRSSTGAIFTLPILSLETDQLIEFLRKRNAKIVVATPEAKIIYTNADLHGPIGIVIGSEDAGVPISWRKAANELVSVPMVANVVDSLNASNTAAILLFECLRQREQNIRPG